MFIAMSAIDINLAIVSKNQDNTQLPKIYQNLAPVDFYPSVGLTETFDVLEVDMDITGRWPAPFQAGNQRR